MDSLGAVELRNAINAEFSLGVPATLAFDYPSVAALADYISSRTQEAQVPLSEVVEASQSQDSQSQQTSEVLAVGCRYPGSVNGIGFTDLENLDSPAHLGFVGKAQRMWVQNSSCPDSPPKNQFVLHKWP